MNIGETIRRIGQSWSRVVGNSPLVTRLQPRTGMPGMKSLPSNAFRTLGPSTQYLLRSMYRQTPFSTRQPVSRVLDFGPKTPATMLPGPFGFSTPLRSGSMPLSAQRLFQQQRQWIESIWGPKRPPTQGMGWPDASPAGIGSGSPGVMRWASLIQRVSKESGVPADVLAAIMEIESGGNPNAVSPAGAVGLMQVMPQYHAHRAHKYGGPLTDPYVNLRVAAEILAEHYARYGDWDKAAAAYFGAIDAAGNITGASDGFTTGHQYVQKFRENRKKYRFTSGEKVPVTSITGGRSYPITQGFWTADNPSWYPTTGGRHPGIDLAVPLRTPLYAPYTGKVVHAGPLQGYGNTVIIDTGFGLLLLGHLDSIAVKPGQVVGVGDPLGLSGSTGFSTGPHLHIEMRDYRGNFIDPALYIAF